MGPLIMDSISTRTESLDNQYRGRDEKAISNLHQVQDSLTFFLGHPNFYFFDLRFMGSRYSLTRKFLYLCNEPH